MNHVTTESVGASVNIVDALEEADPALLLTALAVWKGQPELIDTYADAFQLREKQFRLFLGASDGVHDVEPGAAAEIRAAVRAALDENTPVAPAADIDDAVFQRFASFLVGDTVGSECIEMLREQAGFEKARRRIMPTKEPDPDFEVIIIGSGMSGLAAAVKLAESGFRYKIFEKEAEPGGTWVVNKYPGAAVDTPSHFYSLSFELNPNWQLYFPTGPEYLAYLRHLTDKYGIREHLHCNTRVISCEWHDDRAQWKVTTESAGRRETHWARALVTAVGFLNGPNKPEFPGADRFAGTIMHTAEWDETVSLDGKNVVLVGAGCTAVQVAASTADVVNHLTVVQRHPQWVIPGSTQRPVSDAERWLLANIPYYHETYRLRTFWFAGANGAYVAVNRIDPDWAQHHLSVSPANDMVLQLCLQHIDEMFAGRPDLKAKLTPDYPPMAKRPIIDPGYYQALLRPNVDVRDGSVDHFEADAVVLTDGTRVPCDVLVLATGFHAEWLSGIDIRGRDGVRLRERWGDNPRAYLGVTVPDFPNFFMTCGPNSAPNAGGHNLMSEEQAHFVIECLQLLVEEDLTSLEPTHEANELWNKNQDEEVDKTVWGQPPVRSYQHNSAGRGLVWSPWPALDYWAWLREPQRGDFILR